MNAAESRLLAIASAADTPDITEVEQLLQQIDDINHTLPNNTTLLHLAAVHGHSDLVRALIFSGADVNATCNGVTPAFASAIMGSGPDHLAAFNLLLAAGSHSPFHTDAYRRMCSSSNVDYALTLSRLQTNGFIDAYQEWYSASYDTWRKWNEIDNCDITALSPSMLIRFHGIDTINQALDQGCWQGHTEQLKSLLSHPDIPPYCIQQWLHAHPHLVSLIATPTSQVSSWNHHSTATTLPTPSLRA